MAVVDTTKLARSLAVQGGQANQTGSLTTLCIVKLM